MHVLTLFLSLQFTLGVEYSLGVYYLQFQGEDACNLESYKLPCYHCWDKDSLSNAIYKDTENGNVVDFYKEVSNNNIEFVVDESSIFFIDSYNVPTNLYDSLFSIINGANITHPSLFDYQIFIFPSNWHRIYPLSGPFNLGVGEFNGNKIWIKGCDTDVILHELGHNFGFGHSNSIRIDGIIRRYGDMSSVMGDSNGKSRRGLSSIHRYQRGWLNNTEVIMLNEDNLNITFSISLYPLSFTDTVLQGGSPKNNGLARAPYETQAPEGSFWIAPLRRAYTKLIILNIQQKDYYIEYRTKLNYDSDLGTASSYKTDIFGNYYDSILVKTKVNDGSSDSIIRGILEFNSYMKINDLYITHYIDGNLTITYTKPEFPSTVSLASIVPVNWCIILLCFFIIF